MSEGEVDRDFTPLETALALIWVFGWALFFAWAAGLGC